MLTAAAPVEQLFCELAAIPSPSGRERAVADAIAGWLDAHGIAARCDRAGAVNGSDAGNLIATVPGAPGAPTLLFVAHMDTVESGTPAVTPRVGEDGVIRSAGDTILGADNKSAVAATLRTCAFAAAGDPATRPTVLAAFTCREEAGRMGVSLLDPALVDGIDCAFSVDGSQPIGTVITRALGQLVFTVAIHGRAAHAAADPDAGISAIAVAARAVAEMQLGRLEGGGSASIGSIVGGSLIGRLASPQAPDDLRAVLDGSPTNSVPEQVLLRGEVRGYDEASIERARGELEDAVARACARAGASYEWQNRERAVPPFPAAEGSRALALVRAACGHVARARFAVTEAHATLEANYLAAATDVVAVASGGRDPHQFSESIAVEELRTLEALLCAIVAEASA